MSCLQLSFHHHSRDVCWYLAVAHVGQPLSSLLQVTQTGVNHAIGVAGQLATVLVTGARSSQTLVLRTVRGVAQTDTVLWDAPTNTNVFICELL